MSNQVSITGLPSIVLGSLYADHLNYDPRFRRTCKTFNCGARAVENAILHRWADWLFPDSAESMKMLMLDFELNPTDTFSHKAKKIFSCVSAATGFKLYFAFANASMSISLYHHSRKLDCYRFWALFPGGKEAIKKQFGCQRHSLRFSYQEFSNKFSNWLESQSYLKETVKLDLRGMRLTHLPKQIGFFSNLRELNVTHNLLIVIPKEIDQLEKLETIWLFGNRLKIFPPEIGRLKEKGKIPDLQELHESWLSLWNCTIYFR